MSSEGLGAWIAATPLWAIAISVAVAMILASFAGHALRRWRETRKAAEAGGDEGGRDSHVLGSVLGLLALLMGFTFALAVDPPGVFDTPSVER